MTAHVTIRYVKGGDQGSVVHLSGEVEDLTNCVTEHFKGMTGIATDYASNLIYTKMEIEFFPASISADIPREDSNENLR